MPVVGGAADDEEDDEAAPGKAATAGWVSGLAGGEVAAAEDPPAVAAGRSGSPYAVGPCCWQSGQRQSGWALLAPHVRRARPKPRTRPATRSAPTMHRKILVALPT